MAYKAEIQIGVVGIGQLGTLQKSLNQVSNAVNVINAKQIKAGFNVQNINTYNAQLEKAWQNINKAAMGSKEELKAVEDLVRAKNNQVAAQERLNKLITEATAQQNKTVATADAGFGVQGPKLPPARQAGLGGGPGNRLENVLLGAGFPLLFGGGAGEVAGGVLGSFFGKGFGGQIFLSAIGGQLDTFIAKTGELGRALNPATADVDALVAALGISGTATSKYITQLEELGRKQEALAAVTQELENLVGQRGVAALREFGQDSANLGNEFTKAMTLMQASLAAVINQIGIIKALTDGLEKASLLKQALESKDPRQQDLLRQRETASKGFIFGGSPAAQAKVDAQLIENQRTINAEKERQYQTQLKILEKEQQLKEQLDKIKDQYANITSSVEKRAQAEQSAVERGMSISSARYEAEAALNNLEQTRLERAFNLAQTEQQRFDLAIALFNNAVKNAQIEYQQQLESIAAEERKLQLKLEEYTLGTKLIEQKRQELLLDNTGIQNAELRKARESEINKQADKALAANSEVVSTVTQQLETQKQINQYQAETAKYQLENKILAAQTALEQKLVSDNIGLSQTAAANLSEQLASAARETLNTNTQAQQVVGVIKTATSETYIFARAMGSVAANAANAAAEISRALRAQGALNTLRTGGGSPQTAADGAYWPGGFKAFADGGVVNRPTMGLVGEGGEPEYIIPASKMSEAMARYAAGQRGSSVIPTSINPQVNVTTGPVMNMNGSNYVSQRDFMVGMQTASRRGAEMALDMLQRSGNTRRMTGVS